MFRSLLLVKPPFWFIISWKLDDRKRLLIVSKKPAIKKIKSYD
jgi:hypothetical protein